MNNLVVERLKVLFSSKGDDGALLGNSGENLFLDVAVIFVDSLINVLKSFAGLQ